jgi:hypothetical protein
MTTYPDYDSSYDPNINHFGQRDMNDSMMDESVAESLNKSLRRKPSQKKDLPVFSIVKNLDTDLQN